MPELARTLGVRDSVLIGLGSMIGAGIFAALAPAAQAAGTALPLALAVAGIVAYCNATSSARLAARYPSSGGTYVYGRERLGEFWGYLAGWGFVIGKTASCAAIALTVGAYAWPAHAHGVAVAAVLALTAVNYVGVHKSALLTRVLVAVVLAVLAVVVVVGLGSAQPSRWADGGSGGAVGVLQAAGLLFFAFAGYARIATLGEEVRDPRRTIGLAIPIALGITLVVYALVAAAALKTLGPQGLAEATDPLAQVVRAAGAPGLEPVVRAGAALAALGSLLALILGVSRTTLAMARDGHLPRGLTAVHPRFGVPHHAELLVGAVVAVLAAVADLRHAIGFSSFAVLAYYLIANCSALTLTREEGRAWPGIPILGALGCVMLGFALPLASVLSGLAVLGAGALVYVIRRRTNS
ncbi:APC family permease [Rhodococcus oryzae]|uniref:APC family permease n=1 Tax=Rhodococcus oryzae TaxID=2571143 RepID=UPI003714CE7E